MKKKTRTVVDPPRPKTVDDVIEDFWQWQERKPPIPEPTRFFNVGDEVRYGATRNTYVVRVLDGGKGYLLHYDYMQENSQHPHKVGYSCTTWMDVFPIGGETKFAQKDDIRIDFFNSKIESMLHKVYGFGVDFDPPYQRGLVWNDEQKTSLLDSIFNNIEIGKFTFNELDFDKADITKLYQIIDGKQRLTTICEFYEGRFAYRGKLYHELSWYDRYHFENFNVVQAEMRNATEQQILKLFVKLNTSGTPMDAKHLEKVKSMIVE